MVPDDLWGRIEPPLLPVRPITDADGTQGAITARVQSAAVTPSAFAARLSEHDDLKVEHAKLIEHCAELEQRLKSYATAISPLTLENAALAASVAGACGPAAAVGTFP